MTKGIAVVTGAGSGIGRAVAEALAADGWSLALAGRRREPLDETAAQFAAPASALVVPTDVSNEAAVDRLFEAVAERFGRVDLLFNNAGVGAPPVPMDELPVADWTAAVAANLTGVFLCMRAAFRQMKRQDPRGGRIINNGSISAAVPRPNSAPYTATKHGVLGLTRSGALDGRAHGIAVGQIDIGNAASAMTSRMAAGVLQANGTTAPEPTIDVAHVARTVAHMAALPLEVNILTTTVMATAMPFVGRG
ncbi:SDR family oxidoreductase [Aureimonas leprariae]|uniref:SDR family oxidoreductase n=1 Tax=Plantimonas leprariae TaxID=2615207 RepID=A0A7V7PK23_9HYPH|nr:SDR family oxidoreductase [Aureimonas leprariae]KAB0675834.1 SDR family oxidoreductase [Aureimonas leprariae]